MAQHDLTHAPPPVRSGVSAAHRHLAVLLASADVRLDGQRPWDLQLLGEGLVPFYNGCNPLALEAFAAGAKCS